MTGREREEILARAKDFFRNRIATNHKRNTEMLTDIRKFNVNPFLYKYNAQFAFGDSSPESLAKALLYPRVIGTSISTTFGGQLQFFCNEVLCAFASTTSGIDIEFIDALDNRKKYVQVKAGPNTINKDDVTTIKNHFNSIKNLARANQMPDFNPMYDCAVGVFYGTRQDLSTHYRKIAEDYPVFVGQEFWHHLTGDTGFYDDLAGTFAEVAVEYNSKELMDSLVQALAKQFEETD